MNHNPIPTELWEYLKTKYHAKDAQSIKGGTLNDVAKVATDSQSFFVKWNDALLFPGEKPVPAINSIQLPPFLHRKKSDACVHCGLCLQVCPTFLETGNENDSPRGRIHLMRGLYEVKFPLTECITDHIDRCLGCRACEAVCPSGVEYGGMLEATRHAIAQHRKMRQPQQLLQKVIVERMLTWPNGLRLAVIPARGMRRLGLTKLLPQRLRKMVELIPQKPTRFPQAPSSRKEKQRRRYPPG